MLECFSIIGTLTWQKTANLLQNRLAFLCSRLLKRPIVWGAPSFLSLEPTNQCQLQCPECPSGNGTLEREKGYVSTTLAKELLKEQASHLSYLQLFLQGEPLLHPQLPEIIAYANRLNIFTSVSTNAQLLTTDMIQKLLDAGLHKIIISLDGFTQATYAHYRKGGDVELVKTALETMVTLRNTRGNKIPFIEVQCLVFRHNQHEIKKLQTFAKAIKVDKFTLKKAQLYQPEKKTNWLPSQRKYARYTQQGVSLAGKSACSRLWTTMVVTWDGRVVPCCYDKDAHFAIASVHALNTKQIWQHKDFNQFRMKLLRNRRGIPMCRNCDQ
ncbi:MAG: radical SAM/SPASM domain-containing protein [Bacteroidota bacterium]